MSPPPVPRPEEPPSPWPRVSGASQEETAAGVYGLIVGAAVMAASHAERATSLAVAVLVTLLIYWGAERYARLVAERIHERRRPGWRQVRAHLLAGWRLVTVSFLPLAALVLSRLLGLPLAGAVLCALTVSTALLCVAGWEVGRHGQLRLGERMVSAAAAGMFGFLLIGLKALLH